MKYETIGTTLKGVTQPQQVQYYNPIKPLYRREDKFQTFLRNNSGNVLQCYPFPQMLIDVEQKGLKFYLKLDLISRSAHVYYAICLVAGNRCNESCAALMEICRPPALTASSSPLADFLACKPTLFASAHLSSQVIADVILDKGCRKTKMFLIYFENRRQYFKII